IAPLNAPFPTAWSFPFQFAAGSQTSILMSESLDGFSVAATRQNAGSVLAASPPRPPPRAPGCVKPPAGTACARVIAVLGSVNDIRLSQLVAAKTSIGFAVARASRIAERTANGRARPHRT